MAKLTKKEISWILYDCGNSAYAMTISAALFPIFFKTAVASEMAGSDSTAYLGYANSIAVILVAILAPILGTIADYKGFKKIFFTAFMFLGVLATTGLAFTGKGNVITCLVIYAISSIGFSGANIFYDAFLTDVSDEEHMDKVSSYGFAFGYISSLIPFFLCFLLIKNPGMIGLSGDLAVVQATQISFIITGIWWFLLTLPLLKNVKQTHYVPREPRPIYNSFKRLLTAFKKIQEYKVAWLFLLAYFFYIDGVQTIIKMANAFGQDIGIPTMDLLVVLIVIQIVAFPSSIIYSILAKRVSTKKMLLFGVATYTFIALFAFFMTTVPQFWFLGILIGTSQGGIQALSRSTYGKLIPKENSAEFFGLYNVLGKASAAVGPFLVAIIAQATGQTRYGALSLVILFIIGGLMLMRLDIDGAAKKAI